MDLSPDPRDRNNISALISAWDQSSRSHPEELGKGSRRVIYVWDSGKGWGSLGEVLKPRSGVSPVSVIYLELDNVSNGKGGGISMEEVQIHPLGRDAMG